MASDGVLECMLSATDCAPHQDLSKRHKQFSILARKVCQDCLESLFGEMRQSQGGQRDLTVMAVSELSGKIEAKKRRKARRLKEIEKSRNSGTLAGDDDQVAAPGPSKRKRDITTEATGARRKKKCKTKTKKQKEKPSEGGHEGGDEPQGGDDGRGEPHVSRVDPEWLVRWRLPADAKEQHAAAMKAEKPARARAHPVLWAQLKQAQAEDEAWLRAGHKRRIPKLTEAQHMKRTGFSALKVNLAIHVLSMDVANQLQLRRRHMWV